MKRIQFRPSALRCGSRLVHQAAALLAALLMQGNHASAIDIERFEHIDSRNGLSQNAVLSIYCDKTGFLWFGTFNGLNRYDGYNFKVYKSEPGKEHVLYNNKINEIWEDGRNFLWVRTDDGYYHYLDRSTDWFHTFPRFMSSDDEKNSIITCFFQASRDEIWLGTSNTGVYYLRYDSLAGIYSFRHFFSRGISSITNDKVSFITSDPQGGIWIGTRQGLNFISRESAGSDEPKFQHLFADNEFTCSGFIDDELWLGTASGRILVLDPVTKTVPDDGVLVPVPGMEGISILHRGRFGHVAVGTNARGILVADPNLKDFRSYDLNGHSVKSLYEDYLGNFWVITENFGINRIDPVAGKSMYYKMTPDEIESIVDDERLYIYEDRENNLWIAAHGGGLALFQRDLNRFKFFRNDPGDSKTISSNFVHCITEDRSGLLWVGTGQFNGGVNKAIPVNPSFKQIIPARQISDIAENVVRCVFEDDNGSIWIATKSGDLYIYSTDLEFRRKFDNIPLSDRKVPGQNVYTIMQDEKGYLWLGSKGGGVYVSTRPLNEFRSGYGALRFFQYRKQASDPASLSSNMVYSIRQDHHGRVWIGTYGGGLNLVEERTPERMSCRQINMQNSNLGSDDIRQVFEDSGGRLWIASTFGLHLLRDVSLTDSAMFRVFNYDPQDKQSISYNDVIHIFEDSRKDLWIATYGGGVNKLISLDDHGAVFRQYNESDGLSDGAVFGIIEDKDGYLWFSTQKGISRFDPGSGKMESYNENDGLISSSFNENCCYRTSRDKLIFGTMNGVLLIDPDKVHKQKFMPPVVLTNFQLSNKDVDISDPESPIRRTIETTDRIVLRYNQSSFSIEYAALSYFDPTKNRYAFRLENFDEGWNYVGRQRKATYTNLSPGDYTFRVMASDLDGNWKEEGRALDVLILPPWWRTKLAYAVYILLALVLTEITRRIVTRYTRLRNDLRVERKVSEIKLQFFTNVSHEIRTPLTLILGPLEDIVRNREIPEKIRSSVDIMQRNGKRMLRLINQLLDFRKVQNNKMKMQVREIDLTRFVKTIASNFDQMARQKGITYVRDAGVTGLKAWIDKDMIDSVLFNILSNAFKFTPNGRKIELRVSVCKNEDCVDVSVTDEGPGIPHQKKELIFNRYTELEQSSRYFTGTGIGLALSSELVRMHSGRIIVDSTPGKGSTFTVRLPLGRDHFREEDFAGSNYTRSPNRPRSYEIETVPYSKPAEGTEQQKVHNHTILVVEDHREVRDYIAVNLGGSYNVILAGDGQEGLKGISAVHPDLVITDIMMPGMDGMEMTRKIKEDFEISHIPVIMLTARTGMEDQIEGIETGAEAYVMKPFNIRYLKAVIDNLISQRERIIGKFQDMKEYEPGEIRITNRDEEFMHRIIELIDKHYSDPGLNVDKLAEMSAVGRTLFYHKIKGMTGMTPSEFLRRMRLKIAARMLLSSGYNVSEIAYMVGFNDEKYFRRCFKTIFGKTPVEYKKIKKFEG